jgi:hypothetical protein
MAMDSISMCSITLYVSNMDVGSSLRWLSVGGPLEKTLPRKKIMVGNLNFSSSHRRQKLSQCSTSEVLRKEAQFVCANFTQPQDPVVNNDTLAPNSDAKYLILCETALSRPLGHPDGGRDEAVFLFV